MSKPRKKILIADPQVLDLATLIATLKTDYQVVTATNSRDVLGEISKSGIDMLLLATSLNNGDPFELCRQLKADEQSSGLPVIFVASRGDLAAEAKAFDAGAVDYISKPLHAPILRARIKNQLQLSEAFKELKRLHRLALDANPNTGLPGNNSIMEELKRVVAEQAPVTVVYADLDNFKVYNDIYGFAQGDNIITFTANVIRVAMHLCGCGEAFLGHIGGDDFVMILPSEKCQQVSEEIIKRIDQGILEFYSDEDLARGHVVASDREGKPRNYSFVSLSLGAIDLTRRLPSTALEIIDICTETKKAAKARQGSNLFLDQRRN